MTEWTSCEPGLEGAYDLRGMRALYYVAVNKALYPTFADWLWDMERSATFSRRVG